MKLSRPVALAGILSLVITLAACLESKTEVSTPTLLSTSGHSLPPPTTAAPLPTSTRTPRLTSTPRPSPTNTATTTPVPTVAWEVVAVEIQDWPYDSYSAYASWDTNSSFSVLDTDYASYRIDAVRGKITSIATPAPYAPSFIQLLSSKSKNNEIECSEKGLEMYQLPERQLISNAPILVSDCISVRWAPNETAASIVSDEGQVYIWKIDGTAPYVVGQALPYSWAAWSPDSSKLVVTSLIPEGGFGTFYVVYPDGKPMRITGAKIEAGNGWEPYNVIWLTNDVIQNVRQCGNGGACLSYSYFDANTGKYLIGYIVDNYSGEGQHAFLSPNNRWLALDTYLNEDIWEQRYSYENRVMVLYDLKNQKKYVWADGDDSFIFSGWAKDSNRFYFVRYPLDGQNSDIPLGFFELDLLTLRISAVIPNVLSAVWSPDRSFMFVVTAAKIEAQQAEQLEAAVYTPSGKRVTPSQYLADSIEFERPRTGVIPLEWSHISNQVVFADNLGNLWLFSDTGSSEQIASSLPIEDWLNETAFKWSPDDSRLFAYRSHRAWVANINVP